MKAVFTKTDITVNQTIVVPVAEGLKFGSTVQALDKATGGAIARALSQSPFKGKPGDVLGLFNPPRVNTPRILAIGIGKTDKFDDLAAQNFGGHAVAQLKVAGVTDAVILAEDLGGKNAGTVAAQIAFGANLRNYRFTKYKTQLKSDQKIVIQKLTLMTGDPASARKSYDALEKLAQAVYFTRDIVSEPANIIHPESLADEVRGLAKLGLKVEVLGEKQMQKLGFGALLGVGQGSQRESQLVVIRWDGAGAAKDKRPVAFVGKGVTFDTGGISLKPAANMEDMKWDMAGAAAVIGAMMALALRKAKANVIGVVGLVENMPSGTAQRPGDVVTSMSGQTIEVINTDAEGRLVLADALWYVQEKYKPRAIVDLATLTGAIIISLGTAYAGLFSNDDNLAERLQAAGKAVDEPLWRLPMGDAYDRMLNSEIADMRNVSTGRDGGSIVAAQFLQRFVKDTAWAHLDIAGTAWSSKEKPTCPKGASAFGVRLLDRLIADTYEDRN